MSLNDLWQVFWIALRILAAVAGAFVGWLTTGHLVRLLVRLAFQRPTPRPILAVARVVGAVLVGLLVYYYFPGGSGGWGFGGGGPGGGGSGKGGNGTGTTATAATGKNATMKAAEPTVAADTLIVEMLGGERYKGEGRFYLVRSKEPARTLQEVSELLQKNKGRYRKLEILIYPDSVAREHPAITQLAGLADRLGLTLSITRLARVIH